MGTTMVDGVLFSEDGKVLINYPEDEEREEYRIPEGTQRIEDEAFAENDYLKSLFMPDSVTEVGQRAFLGMGALERVHLSDQLEILPDAEEEEEGVFSDCPRLSQVHFPRNLKYVGDYAFSRTSLGEITLPEGTKKLGAYAFESEDNVKFHLPSTLTALRVGALTEAEMVWAYEGTARGLVNAVNPYEDETYSCPVTVLRRGDPAEASPKRFFIPTLWPGDLWTASEAWEDEHIDYHSYRRCFEEAIEIESRMEIALILAEELEKEGKGYYHDYLRTRGRKLGEYFLQQRDPEQLSRCIRVVKFTSQTVDYLLEKCNEEGYTQEAAALIAYKADAGMGHHKRRFDV